MKKVYEVNGTEVIVEHGSITMGGKLAVRLMTSDKIMEIADLPKHIKAKVCASKSAEEIAARAAVNQNPLVILPREIIAEAARQGDEAAAKSAAKKVEIEGLDELYAIHAEWQNYNYRLERAYNSESAIMPKSPKVKEADVAAKYPRAAAYYKAEGYANASHVDKARAGRRAMSKIAAGGDYEAAIAAMEDEWGKAAQKAVLNS
jgi:hypothetical protein